MKRFHTNYPGVYYRVVKRSGHPNKTEKMYYASYYKDGKRIEPPPSGGSTGTRCPPARASLIRGGGTPRGQAPHQQGEEGEGHRRGRDRQGPVDHRAHFRDLPIAGARGAQQVVRPVKVQHLSEEALRQGRTSEPAAPRRRPLQDKLVQEEEPPDRQARPVAADQVSKACAWYPGGPAPLRRPTLNPGELGESTHSPDNDPQPLFFVSHLITSLELTFLMTS